MHGRSLAGNCDGHNAAVERARRIATLCFAARALISAALRAPRQIDGDD